MVFIIGPGNVYYLSAVSDLQGAGESILKQLVSQTASKLYIECIVIPLHQYLSLSKKNIHPNKEYRYQNSLPNVFETCYSYRYYRLSGTGVKTMNSDTGSYSIVVVGAGYVGLSISVLLAQNNNVTAVDIVPDVVDSINSLVPVVHDNLINKFMEEARNGERVLHLKASTDLESSVSNADYIIISTPTDYDPDTNSFDCSAVEDTLLRIRNRSDNTSKDQTVIIKSTVPVGYTDHIRKKLGMGNIIYSPEFLRESTALHDCLYPTRIVVGCDEDSINKANEFSDLLVSAGAKKDVPVYTMSSIEAEAVKLFANTYLALRISFFNELDTYSEINGLDTSNIIKGVCSDPRIGNYYNNPSFGYGGYCLPKDTKQLLANYENVPEDLIKAIVDSNQTRKAFIAEQIMAILDRCEASDDERAVGIFRLTMKTDSDNFRQSSVLDVIELLKSRGVRVIIYEPNLTDGSFFNGSEVINDADEFKRRCSCIVANRYDHILDDVKDKVYSRDIFLRE